MNDLELVAAANRGDAGAFETLYQRYRDWVFTLALRFTRDHALAHDVTHDTFIYFLRKFPPGGGFQLTAQLKTFLYPVVRHNALALRRKTLKLKSNDVASSEMRDAACLVASQVQSTSESLRELHRAVENLDPPHKEVVILRFVEDLTLQEIALAMEIPLGTVKSRLHHALNSLRENETLRHFFADP